jgi:hypothetical protein
MSSNPPSSAADWPAPGPASREPRDALPAPEDDGWPGGPGRWPTTRAPWPGAGAQNAAGDPEREPAGPAWVVTKERAASGAAGGRRDAGHPQAEVERLALLG